jgi:hypothetical protein
MENVEQHRRYLVAAGVRAVVLGCFVREFDRPGDGGIKIAARVLYHRGIRGLLVS